MATSTVTSVHEAAEMSPGEAFAKAFTSEGERAQVTFGYTVTDAFKPTKERPRVTVRNLFKKLPMHGQLARFWCEARPSAQDASAVHESGLRREAAFRFGMAEARVHPIRAWIQIPPELAGDPAGLAAFIDYRLLVRLATAENQALTIGPHGLLIVRPDRAPLPPVVEQTAGLVYSADVTTYRGTS